MHGEFQKRHLIGIFGQRDCGKSHLGKRILDQYPRKVVIDTMGEHGTSGFEVARNFDEFARLMVRVSGSREFTIALRLSIESDERRKLAEFNEALRVAYYRGDLLLCIEEAHEYCTPHTMPDWLRRAVLLGAHRDLALLFTSQRPGDCHKRLISQAQHVFCGYLYEEKDLKYCRTILGDRAEELAALPERQFLYFNQRNGVIRVNNDLGKVAVEKKAA